MWNKLFVPMRWRKVRLPVRLLLIYMPLIILPALTGMYFVTQSYTNSSKQLTTEYATDLLSLMVQKIDDRLRGYEQLGKQVITDEELSKLFRLKPASMFDKLQNESDINAKLNVLWLGSEQNQYVLSIHIDTPSGSYTYGKNAIGGYGSAESDYVEQTHAMGGGAAWFGPQRYSDGYKEFTAFRLGRLIRDDKLNELGLLTMVIDVRAVTSIFDQTRFQESVALRLLDKDRQEILNNGIAIDKAEKQILTFSEKSIHNGWRLSAQLPLTPLYQPIYKMTKLALVIVVICILVGLIVTEFIAMDLVIPIRKLMVNMKQGIKGIKPGKLSRFRGAVEIVEMNDTFISVMYEIEQLIAQVVKKEKQKKDAEIRVLQNQLSPHFLYNTLNSIRWMAMIQKQDNIKELVDSLTQLLNYSVRGTGEPVPLTEEMAALVNYVNVQKVRFQHFSLEADISEPLLRDALILKFLLQPLVENALIHGLTRADRPGVVRVSGQLAGSDMLIEVSDNGIGMAPDQLADVLRDLQAEESAGKHLGLRSVRERIQLHYGEPYGITISSVAGEGTAVTLKLPYLIAGAMEGHEHA